MTPEEIEVERTRLRAEADQALAEVRDSEVRLRELIKDEPPDLREPVEALMAAGRLRLTLLEQLGELVRRADSHAELEALREVLDALERDKGPPPGGDDPGG